MKSQVEFQSETQAQNVSIELLPQVAVQQQQQAAYMQQQQQQQSYMQQQQQVNILWQIEEVMTDDQADFGNVFEIFSADFGPLWPVTATKTLPKSAQDDSTETL